MREIAISPLTLIVLILGIFIFLSFLFSFVQYSRQNIINQTAIFFTDGFENANSFDDLFPQDLSRWHNTQIDGTNTVELTTQVVHSGMNSVRFISGQSSGASKADLIKEQFNFKRGDDLWFSGWYYIKGGTDTTDVFLWDIEDSNTFQNPGRRLFIQEGEFLASDLGKILPKPIVFRQDKSTAIKVPKDRWFEIKIHLFLHEKDGIMEVWQDGTKIIEGRGTTLPYQNSIYNRLQIGITANERKQVQTIYIDDITVSDKSI